MDKKQFVESVLSNTISEAASWVDHLTYSSNNYEEIVTIHCNNGYCYYVNVNMDSKSAIVSDVIKEIMRH